MDQGKSLKALQQESKQIFEIQTLSFILSIRCFSISVGLLFFIYVIYFVSFFPLVNRFQSIRSFSLLNPYFVFFLLLLFIGRSPSPHLVFGVSKELFFVMQ